MKGKDVDSYFKRDITLGVRISQAENDSWRDFASLKGVKVADLIREAVAVYIDKSELTADEKSILEQMRFLRTQQELIRRRSQ